MTKSSKCSLKYQKNQNSEYKHVKIWLPQKHQIARLMTSHIKLLPDNF